MRWIKEAKGEGFGWHRQDKDIDWDYVEELIEKGKHQELAGYCCNLAQYSIDDIVRMMKTKGYGYSDIKEVVKETVGTDEETNNVMSKSGFREYRDDQAYFKTKE